MNAWLWLQMIIRQWMKNTSDARNRWSYDVLICWDEENDRYNSNITRFITFRSTKHYVCFFFVKFHFYAKVTWSERVTSISFLSLVLDFGSGVWPLWLDFAWIWRSFLSSYNWSSPAYIRTCTRLSLNYSFHSRRFQKTSSCTLRRTVLLPSLWRSSYGRGHFYWPPGPTLSYCQSFWKWCNRRLLVTSRNSFDPLWNIPLW